MRYMLVLGFFENLNVILERLVLVEDFYFLNKWNILLILGDFVFNEGYGWLLF